MLSRVMQVFDRLQHVSVQNLSSAKFDGHTFLSGMIEADEKRGDRIRALLLKIEGMESVTVMEETATTQRVIALFRILCDITGRAEVLQFIHAVNARAIMIRPLWVAFEVVGASQEIEGVYQSAMGYGIVDLISSGCAFMTSANDSESAGAQAQD